MALAASLSLAGCSSAGSRAGEPHPGAGPDDNARPLQLLYAASGGLLVRGLDAGGARPYGALPRGDVFAAQGSRWTAEVVPSRPSGDEDFLAAPRLIVSKVGPDTRRRIVGPGVAPMWDSSGRWVAYLQPDEARGCAGEVCRGEVEVAAFNPVTGASRRLLPAGHYGLLAFSHGRLWASDQADLKRTLVVSVRGRRAAVPIPPAELWDVSPDGRWLVRSSGRNAKLIPLRGGQPAGSGRRVPLAGRLLADGSWAHDSSRVAAVLLPRSGEPGRARVSLFSPADPTPEPQPGTRHAVGQVLWAPDDSGFAVVRAAGRRLTRLRASYCRPAAGSCTSLFSWIQGVVLLRVQRAAAPDGQPRTGRH